MIGEMTMLPNSLSHTGSVEVHYFINNEFVGTGLQPEKFRGWKDNRKHNFWFWAPHSWFAYCPVCGDIWARALSTHPQAQHHARRCLCAVHGGGSLLLLADGKEVEALPHTPALAMYELDLFLQDPQSYHKRTVILGN